MKTFSEFPLSSALQEKLAQNQFVNPTPVQVGAIPPALAGKDVLGTAQTGTGKTLAFLIPILERLDAKTSTGVQSVILVPTRELAMQVMDTFTKIRPKSGIQGALVVGGLSENPQLQAIRRGAQLIVATPGRLQDFLQRRLVRLDKVRILVLDEADRMLDMGFQPAIKAVVDQLPTERQTLFFSATIESSVAPLIARYLKNPVRIEIGSSARPVSSVKLQMFEVATDQKLGLLRNLLGREEGTFLVFARTKHGTEKLAKKLTQAGIEAGRIHGDRSQAQRTAALQGFQQGRYRVLVATDVAARGIHVNGIAHVVNYDLPQIPEDFIHRVGRTGRAELKGIASTFATREEAGEIRRIERQLQVRLERMPIGNDVTREVRGR